MILRKFINDNDTLDGSFRLGIQNRTEVTITVAFTITITTFTITITN